MNSFESSEKLILEYFKFDDEVNIKEGKNFVFDWVSFGTISCAGLFEFLAKTLSA